MVSTKSVNESATTKIVRNGSKIAFGGATSPIKKAIRQIAIVLISGLIIVEFDRRSVVNCCVFSLLLVWIVVLAAWCFVQLAV